jgi:hypothetical protein
MKLYKQLLKNRKYSIDMKFDPNVMKKNGLLKPYNEFYIFGKEDKLCIMCKKNKVYVIDPQGLLFDFNKVKEHNLVQFLMDKKNYFEKFNCAFILPYSLLPTFDFTIYQRNKQVYHNELVFNNFMFDILYVSQFFFKIEGSLGFNIDNKEDWKIFYNGWNHMNIKTDEDMYDYFFRVNAFSALNLSVPHEFFKPNSSEDTLLYNETCSYADYEKNKIWEHTTKTINEKNKIIKKDVSFHLQLPILFNFTFLEYIKKIKKALTINKNCYKIDFLFEDFNSTYEERVDKGTIVVNSNYSLGSFGKKRIYDIKCRVTEQYTSYLRSFFIFHNKMGYVKPRPQYSLCDRITDTNQTKKSKLIWNSVHHKNGDAVTIKELMNNIKI